MKKVRKNKKGEIEMECFENAKVGDRVRSESHGKGTITSIIEEELKIGVDYPICVKFDNGENDFFTYKGEWLGGGGQTIFPYTETYTEKEFVITEQNGDVVLEMVLGKIGKVVDRDIFICYRRGLFLADKSLDFDNPWETNINQYIKKGIECLS